MANDIIDINVTETVETIEITVNPNLTTVNINQVTGGGGGGITDLGYIPSPTNGTVTSSTGSGAVIPLADGTNAGLITPAEKTKIENSVPYTGAVSDVNLGEFGIQLGNLEFDNTPTNIPTTAGSMYYNDTDGTLDLKLKGGNVTLQIGQEQVVRVVNKTATSITLLEANYQAVRITGAQGQRMKVDLAQATNDVLSAETIGLVTETIANNQEGFITTSGIVRGINTTGSLQSETWLDGDILYLSPTVAGRLTKVKPTAPNHLIIIGYVIYAHITQGTIFVKVDNGYELDELHNVKITTPANNNVLAYTSATDIWENKSMGLQEVTNVGASTTNAMISQVSGSSNAITGQSSSGTGVFGISDSGIGVEGNSVSGIGVQGYSETSVGGSFDTDSVSANIANFKQGNTIKAAIQNDGKITATAGTVSTDVVVKSQLDLKANDASVVHLTGNETIGGIKTFSSNIVIPGTGSELILRVSSGGTVSGLSTTTYPNLTELSYVKGVTSAIQTQLNSKQATISLTTTGTSGAATLTGATLNIPQYGGATNLTYTPSPTNGIVVSDTGTDATLPLADATNAGLLKPAKFTVLENTSGTNTGDQNLSGYALLASPTFTGTPSLPTGTTGVTQTAGDNTTKLATTAFVTSALSSGGVTVSPQDTFSTTNIATVTAAQYAAFVTAGTVSATTLYFITA
jgi:hypothetical protein